MIDDEKIIELFFERSEQGIRELDMKYGKICHRLCLLIGGNILDKHRHFRKPLFGVLQCVCRLSAFRCHFLNPAD